MVPRLYVLGTDTSSIFAAAWVINTAGGVVGESSLEGFNGVDIVSAPGGGQAYALSSASSPGVNNGPSYTSFVSTISGSGNAQVLASLPGFAGTTLVVSPDGSRLYVLGTDTSSIPFAAAWVINTAGGVVGESSLEGFNGVDIVSAPGGGQAYALSSASSPGVNNGPSYTSFVSTISGSGNAQVLASLPGFAGTTLVVSPDGSRLYVLGTDTSSIPFAAAWVINTAGGVVGESSLEGFNGVDIVSAPGGGQAYALSSASSPGVNNGPSYTSFVSTISGSGNAQVLASLPGFAGTTLVVSPDGSRLYVLGTDTSSIPFAAAWVINTAGGVVGESSLEGFNGVDIVSAPTVCPVAVTLSIPRWHRDERDIHAAFGSHPSRSRECVRLHRVRLGSTDCSVARPQRTFRCVCSLHPDNNSASGTDQ